MLLPEPGSAGGFFLLKLVMLSVNEGVSLSSSAKQCRGDEYRCASGRCIPKNLVCNSNDDCSDGSDEASCQKPTCNPRAFQCNNTVCVSLLWLCDGDRDCTDGSDEWPENYLKSCQESEFNCGGPTNRCIPKRWQCDGDNDCSDGSDEASCTKPTCNPQSFQCNNTVCVPSLWRCDGDRDCRDGSDEWPENCEGRQLEKKSRCGIHQFQCASGECIHRNWKCDGEFDCQDRSDEATCSDTTESQNHLFNAAVEQLYTIVTGNLAVIVRNESSFMFLSSVRKRCLDTLFDCGSSTQHCIPKVWRCDGDEDCPNGADEKNCSKFFVQL
uniref:Uncharacterized protein n=1 Tax=Amphilophus citrinellus TaxID=61819 RepID=A0A3Q0R3T5_AMPCI